MFQENISDRIRKMKIEPVIAGFLYNKITLAENSGIEVAYKVNAPETEKLIKTSDLVEVLGILFDNAIDAMKEYENPKMVVGLDLDETNRLVVEIANTSKVFDPSELEKFCEYGYSSKGDGRGLGLARLKMIIEKNNADFTIQNKTIDGINYLDFKIMFLRICR